MNIYTYDDRTLTGFQMLFPDGEIKPAFLLTDIQSLTDQMIRTAHLRQFGLEEGIEFMVVNVSELPPTVLPQDNGRPGRRTVLSDSGLYEVLMLTRSPLGASLRHWLSRKVMPAVFRDGYYRISDRDEELQTLRREVDLLKRIVGFGSATLGDLVGGND